MRTLPLDMLDHLGMQAHDRPQGGHMSDNLLHSTATFLFTRILHHALGSLIGSMLCLADSKSPVEAGGSDRSTILAPDGFANCSNSLTHL